MKSREKLLAERPQTVPALKASLIGVLPKEQYKKLVYLLDNMSDDEYISMVEFTKQGAQVAEETGLTPKSSESSLKDLIKVQKQLQDMIGIKPEDTGLSDVPVEYLSDEENELYFQKITSSKPSDTITMDYQSDRKLVEIWRGSSDRSYDKETGLGTIPSDIFFANTIPLMNCIIEINEIGAVKNGQLCNYQVVIFEDYVERINKATDNDWIDVGAVIINFEYPDRISQKMKSAKHILIIEIVKGVDTLAIKDQIGSHNLPGWAKTLISEGMSLADLMANTFSFLETWYGIQIALLHPTVKDVFRKPNKQPIHTNPKKMNNKKKRTVRYIRRHVIDLDELEDKMYGRSPDADKQNSGKNRHCLVWYVVGHWRKRGERKVFIQPYWKGPLRSIKGNLDQGRDRTIDQIIRGEDE